MSHTATILLRAISTAFLALMLVAAPAMAKTRSLQPVDESAKDPKLAALIGQLEKACDDKDWKVFEQALTPDALANFEGDHGPAGFKKVYKIDDPNTPFWRDFRTSLQLGGAFLEDGSYVAPYVYAKIPGDVDVTSVVVGVGPKTTLYDAPKDSAKVLGDVTHQIMQAFYPETGDGPAGWTQVQAGKLKGYVKNDEVRAATGLRAVFQKTENRWWLGAFVEGAGD